jgi:hypothetical protein
MRVNDLKDSLPKLLLFKSFGERIGVVVFVSSGTSKPSCGFLFHQFDLTQRPVVLVSTDIQRSIALESRHLILSMKSIPLGVARHVVRGMDATVSAVRKLQLNTSFPILKDGMRASKPFKGITSTRPHVMIAANENKRVHLLN